MIIDCISDLHGHNPRLDGGDLLIVAGDLTASEQTFQYVDFFFWLAQQPYKKKIFIGGNHDNQIQEGKVASGDFTYLCDSGTEFEGLKIWGSPWTKRFSGMNPKCMAFTVETDEELAEKFALIPDDVDILVTHTPPYTMCDYRPLTRQERCDNFIAGYGSKSLYDRINEIDDREDGKRRILVCGHIHEGYGLLNISNRLHDKCTWMIVNASRVNERYEPVNKPIRVVL